VTNTLEAITRFRSEFQTLFVLCLSLFFLAHPASAQDLPARPAVLTALIEKHCAQCHSDDAPEADFSFPSLTYQLADTNARGRWVRVLDLVENGEMPPADSAKMTPEERRQFVSALYPDLEAASRTDILKNGRGPVRRLTRVEFENNLRVLLKLPDLDIRDKVPADRDVHGFTKVSALLDVSRVQIDAYLDATETALQQALAGEEPRPAPVTKRFTGTDLFPELETFGEREAMFFARNNRIASIGHAEFQAMTPEQRRDSTLELALFRSATWPYYGYPRGFLAAESGAYQVRFQGRAVRQVRDFRLVPALETLAMSFRARQPSGPDVSGDVRETGGWMDLQPDAREFETTIHLKAGETFEYSPLGLPVPFIRTDGGFFYDFPPMPPDGHRGIAIQWLEVTGPLRDEEWPPASHRVLFDDVSPAHGTPADAERLFRRFAALAALRPMSEPALEPFLKHIRSRLDTGESFAHALLAGYQALLCSSYCLYLTEPRAGAADEHFAIANRLSHFLWNSRPDAELSALASGGRLRDFDVLQAQTERMLTNPRVNEFVRTFADEWLDLRKLRRDIPDERLYPEYRKDDYLVDSMELETLAFLTAMVRENLPITTLVSTDFTFVNDRLARHYDLPGVSGSAMQRVHLPANSPFGGLITQAAIMKHTANGTTTSPVLRGVWVMEKLLGQPLPPPPTSVPAIEPDIRGASTIRELLAKHTESQSCARCHAKFDPIGFALENFDVMGAWRDRYRGTERGEKITGIDPAGHPFVYFVGAEVDATGQLPNGETFRDIHELKRVLSAHPRSLARNLLQHLVLYATGTPVGIADRGEIEEMLDASAVNGYRVRDLVHALVRSDVFLGVSSSP
jgi:mono/diheme cytochrome c family protein